MANGACSNVNKCEHKYRQLQIKMPSRMATNTHSTPAAHSNNNYLIMQIILFVCVSVCAVCLNLKLIFDRLNVYVALIA